MQSYLKDIECKEVVSLKIVNNFLTRYNYLKKCNDDQNLKCTDYIFCNDSSFHGYLIDIMSNNVSWNSYRTEKVEDL